MLLVKEVDGGLRPTEYVLGSVYWDKMYKERGVKYLLWIEYNGSIRSWNVFRSVGDDRCDKVNSDLGVCWRVEEEVESLRRYRDLESGQSLLIKSYESILESKKQIEGFVRNLDLTSKNKAGMPLYKPKDVTGALLELEKVSDMVLRMYKKIEVEFDKNDNMRLDKGDDNEFTD